MEVITHVNIPLLPVQNPDDNHVDRLDSKETDFSDRDQVQSVLALTNKDLMSGLILVPCFQSYK